MVGQKDIDLVGTRQSTPKGRNVDVGWFLLVFLVSFVLGSEDGRLLLYRFFSNPTSTLERALLFIPWIVAHILLSAGKQFL